MYSLCFQRFETVDFYSRLLQKLHTFAKSFDEGTPAARENVWTRLYSLMGTPKRMPQDGALFTPLLHHWLKETTINLFGLELLYVSFITSTSANADSNFGDSSTDTVFTPWGHTIPASLYRLDLLKHWESKLEKLSVLHKRAIWNACEQIPFFANFDPKSFRKTLADWYLNPLMNATYITILFGAIGYLKETGVIKCDLCYPRSKVPVFPRRAEDTAEDLQSPLVRNHRRRHAIVMLDRPSQPVAPVGETRVGRVIHPYRRNSSVDLQALVASALATLNSQQKLQQSAAVSATPSNTTPDSKTTEVPEKRRPSRTDFGIDANNVLPVGFKRRRSSCGDENKPLRQRRRSIMAINSLLC